MNTLIQFPGDDQRPRPKPTAYSQFLLGYDTAEIAAIRGEPEHVVLRAINVQRSRDKGLPIPYEARK